MNLREEWGRALAGGLAGSWQVPLVQPAACRLFRGGPLQMEFLSGLGEDAEKLTESPAQSSVSEAASDMESSSGSSSDPPKETRSLALAEGRCFGHEKRTGDGSLIGEGEARGCWAGVSSPKSGR